MNLALLAKQGWRVVTRQASLLYKLLKGCNFRNKSFLNAKVGSNMSFGWRSMLEGRKVLRKGLDGGQGMERVNGTRTWVEALMGEADAKLIRAIAISKRQYHDRLVWHHTKSGNYLTSSRYLSARDMNKNGELGSSYQGETSSNLGQSKIWQQIWELKISPRVKNFMWKWLDNALLTKVNLRRRGVIIENRCPLCNKEPKTTSHLLFHCEYAARLWYIDSRLVGEDFAGDKKMRGWRMVLRSWHV
ncbi:hypothetical protein LIER_38347 [Lithospermum erythrorhizon]|uniref:Reverse transcriptase zinc-binding domain-containing protein n=1 Tax=Lithospermum erythrorhizon TaxID=34254 RepID=A0AAV3PYF4_LITER